MHPACLWNTLVSDLSIVTSSHAADSISTIDLIARVHGSLASIAFLVLFPTGAILIRLASFPNLVWVHAALQVLSYVVFVAAAGLGIHLAIYWDHLSKAHPIIGLLLLSALFFQAPAGISHHLLFKKKKKRTAISYYHIYAGRIIIILGMINGGLGLELGLVKSGYRAAYGIVAGVMGVAYITSIVIGEMRQHRRQNPGYDAPEAAKPFSV